MTLEWARRVSRTIAYQYGHHGDRNIVQTGLITYVSVMENFQLI